MDTIVKAVFASNPCAMAPAEICEGISSTSMCDCADPMAVDDVHLLLGKYAAVLRDRRPGDSVDRPGSLYLTSLRRSSSKIDSGLRSSTPAIDTITWASTSSGARGIRSDSTRRSLMSGTRTAASRKSRANVG